MQNLYGELFPTACTWFAVANILVFFVTNSIDSRHADRLRQRSALGELFKYSCDCCSTVFFTILATYCLGGVSRELSLLLLVHLDDINFTHRFPYRRAMLRSGMPYRPASCYYLPNI